MADGKRKLSKFGDIFDRPPPKCNAPHPCHICSPPDKSALDCKLESHETSCEESVKAEKGKIDFHLHHVSTRRESKDWEATTPVQNGLHKNMKPETNIANSSIPGRDTFVPPYLPRFSSSWQLTRSHKMGHEETLPLLSDVRVVLPGMSVETFETLNMACSVADNIVRLRDTLKLPTEETIIAPVIEVYLLNSSVDASTIMVTLPVSAAVEDIKIFWFDLNDQNDPPPLSEVKSKNEVTLDGLYYCKQNGHNVTVYTKISCGIVCLKYGKRRRKMMCSLSGELHHLHDDAEIILRLYMYHDELITEGNEQEHSVIQGKTLIPPVFLQVDFDDILSKESGLLSVVTVVLCIEKQYEQMWCHKCNELDEPMYPGLLDVCLSDVLEKLDGDASAPFEIKWCLLQCHEKALEGLAGSIEVEFLTLHKPPKTTRMAFSLGEQDLRGLNVQ